MRLPIFLSLCLLPGFVGAADSVRPPNAAAGCELGEPTFDSRELVCWFAPGPAPRRYTLQVNFSGGHDDTIAELSVASGTALVCEEGSKTRLMGEDGDVNLSCLFTASGGSEIARLLVVFKWSHAQYVGYSLTQR